MFCRRIKCSVLFFVAFFLPVVAVLEDCNGQTALVEQRVFRGGKFRWTKYGNRVIHQPSGPQDVTATGMGDNEADACRDGLLKLVAKLDPQPQNNEYVRVASSDNCCETYEDLCPKPPKPLLLAKGAHGDCGKYLVRVSCVDCATGGEIWLESRTDHPHLEAIRMRRDFRKYLKVACLECNGRIQTQITEYCDCGCN
jgi:hypothetical protein